MRVKTHGVCLGLDGGQRGEWEQPERMVEGDRVMGSWGGWGAAGEGQDFGFGLGEHVMQEGDMILFSKRTTVAETLRGCDFLNYP